MSYLTFEKRYSAHTILAYQTDLAQFFIYVEAQYQTVDITAINHFIIRSWVVSLMEAKLNPRSVNRKITVLKTFYKFLLLQGLVSNNPMEKIVAPKTAKRLPVFVDKPKMNKVLDVQHFSDDFLGKRNRLILELFYATGVRLSELCAVTLNQISLDSLQIKVLGKRNKERIIPFNQHLIPLLHDYLQMRKQVTGSLQTEINQLLITDKAKPVTGKQIYHIVRNSLGQHTTLQKRSPHVLRHTFATHLLDNGADINAIKELLGHSSLAATQVYTHNTIEKLKNIHKQAHPRN
ncbi:MAG TPA: tyrosine-type recombinase/integrase [Bacteroidia bacterium]|nr:tyrosine-type recombinase/integrase [Bacteroidia bacterium]